MSTAAAFLLTYALHGTALLGVAWVACALLRDRALALQECLCRFALWGGLLSSALQWFLCGGPWFPVPTVSAERGAPLPLGDVLPRALMEAPLVADSSSIAWQALLVAMCTVTAVLGLSWLAHGLSRLQRALRDRRPETSPRLLATAAQVAEELGLRHSPRLSRCDDLSSPLAFGWSAPEVCLPARANELGDRELRAMLAHELAHLRRRDPFWLWLGAAMQAMFPWQLLLLPVRRRLHHVAELRCDAAAGRCAGHLAVARCLLQVADWVQGRGRPLPAAALAMAARPSTLRIRVESALAGRSDPGMTRWAVALVPLLALTVLTAAAPGVRSETGAPEAGPLARSPVPWDIESLAAQRAAVWREMKVLAARLEGARDDRELQRLWGRLQARLAELADASVRLDAALARRDGTEDPDRGDVR